MMAPIPDFRLEVKEYAYPDPFHPENEAAIFCSPALQMITPAARSAVVQQRRGPEEGKVSFFNEPMALQNLKEWYPAHDTRAPKFSDAHGVILRDQALTPGAFFPMYRRGDLLWVEEERNGGSNPIRDIHAINLRTFRTIIVPVGDVCWVPTHRTVPKSPRLLTVCGSWKDERDDDALNNRARLCVMVDLRDATRPVCAYISSVKFKGTSRRGQDYHPPDAEQYTWVAIAGDKWRNLSFGTLWNKLSYVHGIRSPTPKTSVRRRRGPEDGEVNGGSPKRGRSAEPAVQHDAWANVASGNSNRIADTKAKVEAKASDDENKENISSGSASTNNENPVRPIRIPEDRAFVAALAQQLGMSITDLPSLEARETTRSLSMRQRLDLHNALVSATPRPAVAAHGQHPVRPQAPMVVNGTSGVRQVNTHGAANAILQPATPMTRENKTQHRPQGQFHTAETREQTQSKADTARKDANSANATSPEPRPADIVVLTLAFRGQPQAPVQAPVHAHPTAATATASPAIPVATTAAGAFGTAYAHQPAQMDHYATAPQGSPLVVPQHIGPRLVAVQPQFIPPSQSLPPLQLHPELMSPPPTLPSFSSIAALLSPPVVPAAAPAAVQAWPWAQHRSYYPYSMAAVASAPLAAALNVAAPVFHPISQSHPIGVTQSARPFLHPAQQVVYQAQPVDHHIHPVITRIPPARTTESQPAAATAARSIKAQTKSGPKAAIRRGKQGAPRPGNGELPSPMARNSAPPPYLRN